METVGQKCELTVTFSGTNKQYIGKTIVITLKYTKSKVRNFQHN